MFTRTVLAASALAFLALTAGCAASPDAERVDQTSDELSLQKRTFRVSPDGNGCKLPYSILFVKRGGRVTFDNGAWLPASTELTSDDNLSMLIEWPNALGEDGAAQLDLTIGTKKSVNVPYLDDELYGDSDSLDFELYCIPEMNQSAGWGQPQATIRIFR